MTEATYHTQRVICEGSALRLKVLELMSLRSTLSPSLIAQVKTLPVDKVAFCSKSNLSKPSTGSHITLVFCFENEDSTWLVHVLFVFFPSSWWPEL